MDNEIKRGCQFCKANSTCHDAYSEHAQLCGNYEQRPKKVELRKYAVCLDCGNDLLLTYVPAENEETVRRYCEGQGHILAIKDLTKDSRYRINLLKIDEALKKSDMVDRATRELTIRALSLTGIAD